MGPLNPQTPLGGVPNRVFRLGVPVPGHGGRSGLGWGERRENLVAEATRLGGSGGKELILGDPGSAVASLENATSG